MHTTKFPENIGLSKSYRQGDLHKMVIFFDPKTEKYQTEHHPEDYEIFMRQRDAVLLRDMVECFYEGIKAHVASAKVYHEQATNAVTLLKTCWRALGPAGDTMAYFNGMEPYSPPLMNQAASFVRMATEVLLNDTLNTGNPSMKRLWKQLEKIADAAENRYEPIVYAESLITEPVNK